MEGPLIVLLMVVAGAVVGWGAKNGAEREARRREERWAHQPAPAAPRLRPRVDHVATRASGGSASSRAATGTESPRRPLPAPAARSGSTSERAAAAPSSAPARAPGPASSRPRPERPTVNLNEAPADDLRQLPGVGLRAAERIVAHRDQHGPFATVGDLEAVEGFDSHRIARLADSATV